MHGRMCIQVHASWHAGGTYTHTHAHVRLQIKITCHSAPHRGQCLGRSAIIDCWKRTESLQGKAWKRDRVTAASTSRSGGSESVNPLPHNLVLEFSRIPKASFNTRLDLPNLISCSSWVRTTYGGDTRVVLTGGCYSGSTNETRACALAQDEVVKTEALPTCTSLPVCVSLRQVWKIFHQIYGGGPVIIRSRLDIYSDTVASERVWAERDAPLSDVRVLHRRCGNPDSLHVLSPLSTYTRCRFWSWV